MASGRRCRNWLAGCGIPEAPTAENPSQNPLENLRGAPEFCVEQVVHRSFVFMKIERFPPGRCVEHSGRVAQVVSGPNRRVCVPLNPAVHSVVKEQRLAASASGEFAFAKTGTATSDYRSRLAESGREAPLDRGPKKVQLYEIVIYIVERCKSDSTATR
jgi:hypothetical protein